MRRLPRRPPERPREAPQGLPADERLLRLPQQAARHAHRQDHEPGGGGRCEPRERGPPRAGARRDVPEVPRAARHRQLAHAEGVVPRRVLRAAEGRRRDVRALLRLPRPSPPRDAEAGREGRLQQGLQQGSQLGRPPGRAASLARRHHRVPQRRGEPPLQAREQDRQGPHLPRLPRLPREPEPEAHQDADEIRQLGVQAELPEDRDGRLLLAGLPRTAQVRQDREAGEPAVTFLAALLLAPVILAPGKGAQTTRDAIRVYAEVSGPATISAGAGAAASERKPCVSGDKRETLAHCSIALEPGDNVVTVTDASGTAEVHVNRYVTTGPQVPGVDTAGFDARNLR